VGRGNGSKFGVKNFKQETQSLNIYDGLQFPTSLSTFLGTAPGKDKLLVSQTNAKLLCWSIDLTPTFLIYQVSKKM
jgi:hypothetical protein